MNEGDIILTPIPQADGRVKNRPALVLRELPPFGDLLVCGISTQLHHAVPGFDEIIRQTDSDYSASGLLSDSLIRLSFLAVLPKNRILGSIGTIDFERYFRLLERLSDYLVTRVRKTSGKMNR